MAAVLGLCLASPGAANQGEGEARPVITASYLYSLSDFTGTLPFTWVRVSVDDLRNEVYVAESGSVSIFNEAGMEIYRFGEDERLGQVLDVAALASGDLLLLTHQGHDSTPSLVRCDYRGGFLERRPLAGLPSEWEGSRGFRPTRMVLRGETLYLADLSGMRVAVADAAGAVRETVSLGPKLQMSGQQVGDSGLGGFDAGHDGTLYFTVPTQFRAFRMAPGREPEGFGQAGSSPGRFGVIAGIAADRNGTLYVVDTLKCAVMAFGPDLEFATEFGYRSFRRPEGLIAPKEATVADNGRLYVTQQARKGVSVFRVGVN